MHGLFRMGNISFGTAFVAGNIRVPKPAAGITALRTFNKSHLVLAAREFAYSGSAGIHYTLSGLVMQTSTIMARVLEVALVYIHEQEYVSIHRAN